MSGDKGIESHQKGELYGMHSCSCLNFYMLVWTDQYVYWKWKVFGNIDEKFYCSNIKCQYDLKNNAFPLTSNKI